jgi:hypothetical protein
MFGIFAFYHAGRVLGHLEFRAILMAVHREAVSHAVQHLAQG